MHTNQRTRQVHSRTAEHLMVHRLNCASVKLPNDEVTIEDRLETSETNNVVGVEMLEGVPRSEMENLGIASRSSDAQIEIIALY